MRPKFKRGDTVQTFESEQKYEVERIFILNNSFVLELTPIGNILLTQDSVFKIDKKEKELIDEEWEE